MIYCENVVKILWTRHFFFFTLPQISEPLFFFPHFRQCHCHNCYNFFIPYFVNGIATISLSIFFFFSLWALHAHLSHPAAELGKGISVSTLSKFNIFFLHLFLLLSHTFGWISAMALPQLVCQFFFFFSLQALHAHPSSRIGHRKFGISVAEIQHFLSPPFSSSLLYFWLNFGNGNTEIQSLSSKSQISLNSSYNAN